MNGRFMTAMCHECGALIEFRDYDSITVARDHVLDIHRDHPKPLDIVFTNLTIRSDLLEAETYL